MEYKGFTAKSIHEAITQACLDLGVTSDRLDYKIMQEPTSGFLGIGSKPAIISARVREEEESAKPEVIPEISFKGKNASGKAARDASAASRPAEKSSGKHPDRSAEKRPGRSAEKQSSGNAEKRAEKTNGAGLPTDMAAEEKKDVHIREDASSEEGKVITSDEIEKRAQAAAQRAQSEGRGTEAREFSRPRRSEEGRERRGRRNEKQGHKRHNSEPSYEKAREELVHHEVSRPKPQRVVKERSEEEISELIRTTEEFLKGIFASMQIEAEMELSYDAKEGAVNCTISGSEMGLLIGKRGQTLDSLQYLTSIVVNKKTDEYVRVKLDTEDYRSRRADTLNNLARNISYKVKRSHRPVALEPMNPYERRIIHSALQNNRFVETYSEGEEPYRHVVVAPRR